MSKSLAVNGVTFSYPENGDDPGWGGDASGWAEQVTDVLSNLNPEGTILQTEITLVDNQTSYTDINTLSFDSANVRSAIVEYVSTRSDDAEFGMLFITYDGSDWLISRQSTNGDTGLDFDISSLGKIQYKSTSTGFDPVVKFRAKTILNQ